MRKQQQSKTDRARRKAFRQLKHEGISVDGKLSVAKDKWHGYDETNNRLMNKRNR